jgi:Cupin-like domain
MNRPVIIEKLMSGWMAMTSWTPEYLKDALGDLEVEVMTGRNADPRYERNADRHRKNIRFGSYVDMVCRGGVTNDYYMVANNGFFRNPEARRLLDDIEPLPPYLRATCVYREP